jgi:hypothetical protein
VASERHVYLARAAVDRCLARALMWGTSLERADLADVLLEARALAIAMADAVLATPPDEGDDWATLQAAAESAAHEVFLNAVRAREAEESEASAAEAGEGL